MPAAVQADLGQDEWPVTRNIVKPGKIGCEGLLRLEEDIETHEVEKGELQVLRGGIIDVGDERVWILGLGDPVQSLDVPLHSSMAVPAHDRSRDLVSNSIAEDGRVTRAGAHAAAHPLDDFPCSLPVVQECDMFFPRKAHHDPQASPLGRIEEPARGDRVGANGV